VGPALLPGRLPRFPGWAGTRGRSTGPSEAVPTRSPDAELSCRPPAPTWSRLSPDFPWGQPCLPAAASGTAAAGEKRWIVPPRVPGTSPGAAAEVCLRVSSPCSLFRGATHSIQHHRPATVRVASGQGSLPFWGVFSSSLPSDRRIKAAWLNGNRSTAPKPLAIALLQAHPSPLPLALTVHVSRPQRSRPRRRVQPRCSPLRLRLCARMAQMAIPQHRGHTGAAKLKSPRRKNTGAL